jgi:hypothetical protein
MTDRHVLAWNGLVGTPDSGGFSTQAGNEPLMEALMDARKHLRSLAALGGIAFLAACATTRVTATGPGAPAQGGPCSFEILTIPPSGSYREIGVVNAQLGDYGSNEFSTLSDFKKEIAARVCSAGGDVAVAYANDAGIYIRATILKFTAKPTL